MELLDTIKYFAKFPKREGILKCFSGNGADLEEYTDFKNFITNLEGNGLMPEIEDFVISINEKEVGNRVKNINGYFLFIEYAGINGSPLNEAKNRSIDFQLAIMVAHHWNRSALDSMSEAIIMDNCLNYLVQISKTMQLDDKLICANRRLMDGAIRFQPVEPELLYQSIGWELSFKKTINNLL